MPLTPHKDMLFGVGLGCLLQMFQNNNIVTVCLILYTQCFSFSRKDHIHVTGCYILYNHLRICCKLLVSWILRFRWVMESDLCCVLLYGQLEPEGVLCWVLSGALGLSLVFSFIAVPLQCFHLNRVYGFFLLIFYIVFLIVALLTEFRIIQFWHQQKQ